MLAALTPRAPADVRLCPRPTCYLGDVFFLAQPSSARRTLQRLTVVAFVLGLTPGCQGRGDFFAQLAESNRLAADLRVQFTQAADASNRAVMADTDAASLAFAHDAEKALRTVDAGVTALGLLLHSLTLVHEIQALEDFGKNLAKYREIDRTILALAVENTNLKAQQVAFGPALEAADAFRDALATIAPRVPPKARCGAEGAIAKAVLAVREIQVLYGPHIAESSDATMTKMEQKMAALDTSARAAVESLAGLIPKDARPTLTTALSALERFKDLSHQIVALSRRNSNVRSLELSLQTKPALTAACDQNLRALQDLLAKEDIKATR